MTTPARSRIQLAIEALAGRAHSDIRTDGWANAGMGLGIAGRDRTVGMQHEAEPFLDPEACAALFHHDAISARIASLPVDDSLRNGFALSGETSTEVGRVLEQARMLPALSEGLTWGRALGGAVILIGVDSNTPASDPLPHGAPLLYLDVYDRRDVRIDRITGLVRITSYHTGTTSTWDCHPSRLLKCPGILTGDRERQELQGWDASVYQRCWKELRDFRQAYASGGQMLSEASVGVFKMWGLINFIASKKEQDIFTRAGIIDLTKSIAQSIFLDADPTRGESYHREAIPFAGVPDMLDRSANLLSAATGIPVTKLMGQSPAGLNATGESDIRNWYDVVGTYRRDVVLPMTRRLVEIASEGEGLAVPSIVLPSLWQESPKEKADREKIRAEIDTVYYTIGVLSEDRINRSRFRPEGFSDETISEPLEAAPSALPAKPKLVPSPPPNAPAPPAPNKAPGAV